MNKLLKTKPVTNNFWLFFKFNLKNLPKFSMQKIAEVYFVTPQV